MEKPWKLYREHMRGISGSGEGILYVPRDPLIDIGAYPKYSVLESLLITIIPINYPDNSAPTGLIGRDKNGGDLPGPVTM